MYKPESDSIKITDFGIARITNSSKTGTVLGTPTGMSAGQFASQNLDGRLDLFSPGVMLFQLLTGSRPYQADSMASFMFKITNPEASDINSLCPDKTDSIASIARKKLLEKVELRFQTGTELADHLKADLASQS